MTVIVVIDDRVTNRKILSKLAASLEKNSLVKSFGDPAAALEWVKDNTPDLVVTDFKMPNMDGAEFTRAFRRQPLCFDIPVMVVTVFEDRDFRYRALEAGATDFLLSPIDHREFRVRARNLLTLREQQQLLKQRASELEQRLTTSGRQHQEEMRRSKEQLLNVIDAVPAMISATDEDTRCVFINRYQAAFLGINPDDAVGMNKTKLYGENFGTARMALDRRIIETGESPPPAEEVFVDRSGEKRILLTTKRPLRDETGRTANVVTVSMDITDRKKAELALADQERFLRTVIDNDPNFIFTTTASGRISLANKSFADIFGKTVDQVIDCTYDEIGSDPREAAQFIEDDASVLDGRRSLATSEWAITTASGERRWVQFTKLRIATVNDSAQVLTVGIDVTERRKVEETLRRAKEEAEAANRSKTDFLANMSHELRTPLNAIIGFSGMIERGMLGPVGNTKYLDYAKNIGTSAQHLLSIINDILEVSKIEAGKADLREEEINVEAAVGDVLRIVGSRAEEEGLRLESAPMNDLPYLLADERKVKQILLNIVSNGIKFTATGGYVRVSAETASDGGITIRVADDGIGIAAKDISCAVERFGQVAEVLTRENSGTGLGLPLSIGLVELHGGKLTIESEEGKGTTVTIRFPAERSVERMGEAHENRNVVPIG